MDRPDTCGSCRFFDPAPGNSSNKGMGMCRRHAPSRIWIYQRPSLGPSLAGQPPNMQVMPFPIISFGDWCGEWRGPPTEGEIARAEAAAAGPRQ